MPWLLLLEIARGDGALALANGRTVPIEVLAHKPQPRQPQDAKG
jgi:hypothetical protein